MKSSYSSRSFDPVNITITCETADELCAMWALFNIPPASQAEMATACMSIINVDLEKIENILKSNLVSIWATINQAMKAKGLQGMIQ